MKKDLKDSILNSKKGLRVSNQKRTICEVNREIYDLCITELLEKDEDLCRRIVALVEEAFIMGMKMNNKLIEYKFDTDKLFDKMDESTIKKNTKKRKERARLLEVYKSNQKLLKDVEKGDKNGK
jgi:hypothetical protein